MRRLSAAQSALYQSDSDEPEAGRADQAQSLIRRALPKGAVILGILFVVNAGSGFLAKKVLGHVFGAGPELDALWNAIALTSFPVTVLVLGGVIGPFLPLFVGLKGEADSTARDFARTILTCALLATAVAMGLLFVFAPFIAPVASPGFVGDQRDLYIGLIRAVALGQVAIAASMVLGEILIAERRYLAYGLAEFAQYAGLAAGALLLSPFLGIYGAALGFLLGALGHLGVRLVGIYRTSFRPRPLLALRTKGVGEFLVLMLPNMVSRGLTALFLLYFGQIASTLATGSVTSVNYAQDFQSTAESVVGLSFALAAFPALSAAAAAGDRRTFKRVFRTNLLTIGLISVLAAVTLGLFAGVIAGLFRGGAFDDTDVSRMSMVLIILAISVPFECLVELYARAIFATHNTLEPTLAVAAGFVVGVITTTILSGPLGLAALPLGYVAFRAVHLMALAVFLRPRIDRIGGSSRWSRAIVHDRWGGAQVSNRRSMPVGQMALLTMLLATLTAGTLFAGAQALSRTSLLGDPQTTPWARVNGTREPVLTIPPASPTMPSVVLGPTPSPAPSGTPGIFVMDLYREGDFVSESKDTWCIAAAMQTSINMMSVTADTTRDTQAKLFDLAVSIGGLQKGGSDPDGWAGGLSSLGYGKYSVGANVNMTAAVHTVAKQIRLTERPGGLVVWRGWHSWVVSGFTATADPATTDKFTVLTVRIEDVWYPRVSDLWPKSRGPDADVPVSALPPDYKPWLQSGSWPGRDGMYVYVIPEE
jgi:putative peptidoglycan lipid II flippase